MITIKTKFGFSWHLFALLLSAGVAALCLQESIPTFSKEYLGGFGGDVGIYTYLIHHTLHSHSLSGLLSPPIFYPYSLSLGFSDLFFIPSLLVGVLSLFVHSEVLQFNLLIALARTLTGYCSFRLMAYLTGNPRCAFFAAIATTGMSYLTAHLGHPQLQFLFFIPLGAELLLRFLKTPTLLVGLLVGLNASATLLSSAYYAVFLFFVSLLIFVSRFLPAPFFGIKGALGLTGVALGLMPSLPFLLAYRQVKETFGGRALYEASAFSAVPLSYLSASFSNVWAKVLYYGKSEEEALFPGAVLLLLLFLTFFKLGDGLLKLALLLTGGGIAFLHLGFDSSAAAALWAALVMGLFAARTHMSTSEGLMGSLFIFFLFLSFGPFLNAREPGNDLFGMSLRYLPGLEGLRVSSRAGVIALLFLSFLASLTFGRISLRHSFLSFFLVPLFLYESSHPKLSKEAPPPAPQAFAALKEKAQPGESAIMLPYAPSAGEIKKVERWGEFAKVNTYAMNWGRESGVPLVNGYSGVRTKVMRELPLTLSTFPSEKSRDALLQFGGLRYVIYVPKLYPAERPLPTEQPWLSKVKSFGDGSILFRVEEPATALKERRFSVPSSPDLVLTFETESKVRQEMTLLILDASGKEPLFKKKLFVKEGTLPFYFPLSMLVPQVRPSTIVLQASPTGSDLFIRKLRAEKRALSDLGYASSLVQE